MDEDGKQNGSWWQTVPGILTAVATAITALAGLLGVLHEVGWLGVSDHKTATAAQIGGDCSTRPGYPKGRWAIIAKSKSPDAFAEFITFTRADGGTWLPSSGQGDFEAIPAPAPGSEVVLRFHPASGNYTSTNKLIVSANGCRMEGTFADTEGHTGEANYVYEAP